jgi:hypothetical protein
MVGETPQRVMNCKLMKAFKLMIELWMTII